MWFPLVTARGSPLTGANQRFELPVMAAVKYTPLPSRAQLTPERRRPSSPAMRREPEPSAFIT